MVPNSIRNCIGFGLRLGCKGLHGLSCRKSAGRQQRHTELIMTSLVERFCLYLSLTKQNQQYYQNMMEKDDGVSLTHQFKGKPGFGCYLCGYVCRFLSVTQEKTGKLVKTQHYSNLVVTIEPLSQHELRKTLAK